MKKIVSVILSVMLAVTLLAAMSGCGNNTAAVPDNNSVPQDNVQNTEQNAEDTEPVSQPQTENDTADNTVVLEELAISDNRSGDVWTYYIDAGAGEMVVSAGYCTDNDVVYDFTFSVDLSTDSSEYMSFKTELQEFESQLSAIADDDISFDLDETEKGLEFALSIDGLEKADRGERVKLAEEIIGVTANDSDTSFRYSEIDAELKGYGFE